MAQTSSSEAFGRHAVVAAGGLLAGAGFGRGGTSGAVLAAAGLGMVLAGLRVEEDALRRPARLVVNAGPKWAAELRHSVTIARPRREVFAFFRNHCALTAIAPHIERVQLAPDANFGRWVVETPLGPLHYEAELTDYREPERVAWRALPGTDVQGEGWVEFRDAAGGRATEVHVFMRWPQPLGRFGRFAAWLAGQEPGEHVRATLEHARERVESDWQPPLPRAGDASAPEIAGRRPLG